MQVPTGGEADERVGSEGERRGPGKDPRGWR
jgi:hypothetical protein